jgi:hypothetical protein
MFLVSFSRWEWLTFIIEGLPVPAILHVCRQARIEGLPHYELIHQNGLNKDGEDDQLEAAPAKMLYVNFKADQFILYSVSSDVGFIDKLNFDKTVLKNIQHPAVYCYAWNRGMSDTQSALLRARLLASIFHTYKAKELTVIYHRAWALSRMGDSLARHLFRRTVLDSLPSRFEMPAGEKWWWGCPQTITDDLSMPLNVLWDVIDDDDLSPWYTMGETAVSHRQ